MKANDSRIVEIKHKTYFQYIGDLTAINDWEFQITCKGICSPEHELKKDSMGYSERFLFNSGIKIEHKNIKIHTYDESNDFLFSIGRMPQIISYVPPKMS